MFAESPHHFVFFPFREFTLQFIQREVHDVVVVNFLSRELVAHLQPDFMQQIDFFRRQPRRMRPR